LILEEWKVGYLGNLKRDEGPEGNMTATSPREFAQRRKQANRRMGRNHAKDQHDEQLNTTHQPF